MTSETLIQAAGRVGWAAAFIFFVNLVHYFGEKATDDVPNPYGLAADPEPFIPLWIGIACGVLAALMAVAAAVEYASESRSTDPPQADGSQTGPPLPSGRPDEPQAAGASDPSASTTSLASRFAQREWRMEAVAVLGLALSLAQILFFT